MSLSYFTEKDRRGSRSSQGFTLLELMLTILIASILAAIAIPAFRTMSVGTRLTTEANDLVSAINLGRSEAIKRNGTLSFCRVASSSATTCVTSTGIWTDWVVVTSGGTVLRRGTLERYGNTLIVRSNLTNDTMTFASDGLVRTGGALVTNSQITVCATNLPSNYMKWISLGSGSRISVGPGTGACS